MKTATHLKQINIPVLHAFCTILPKMIRVSPGFFFAWQVIALLHGLSYGIIAPITQYFFDLATDFALHQEVLSTVIIGLVILGFTHVGKQALNGIANFMNMIYYRKTEGAFSVGLHEKMSRINPICFEDTKTLDDMNKAIEGKNQAVWFTGTILLTCTFYLPYFICMAFYLITIKPLLVVSLALVFTPTLFTQIFRTKVFSKAEDKAAPIRRELDYYENCMVDRVYFKETRILGAFSYFRKLFADSLSLLNKLRFQAAVKSDLAELGMQMLSLSGYIGILLLLLDSLLQGDISVGAFAAIFTSVDQMFALMKELLCNNMGAVARDFGRVQNYLRFIQLPEREGERVALGDDTNISLHEVSFTYPGGEKKAVDRVSLHLKQGETVAIVGENGSGKSTLVRLITGLYLPDDGDVRYGGISTKSINANSLYKKISAVFQNYQRYQMTLCENIGISDVDKRTEEAELNRVCAWAGIDGNDAGLHHGYDTMLSREFDGVDLSGGQWQRIAIARSFFRSHQMIILDEPTAAIDPIEETKIYNRFAEISKDKTALIITHRLGSVKLADRILVMKQGRLVEQGTHGELMKSKGEYARLYQTQERWYQV